MYGLCCDFSRRDRCHCEVLQSIPYFQQLVPKLGTSLVLPFTWLRRTDRYYLKDFPRPNMKVALGPVKTYKQVIVFCP